MVEQAPGQLVEVVVPLAAFEEIAEDHRVRHRPADLEPRAAEDEHVVLEVLADLLGRRVRQDRPEGFEDVAVGRAAGSPRAPDGDVIRLALLPGEREADQLGPERVERGRLGVDAEFRLCLQLVDELGERLGRVDDPCRRSPRPISGSFALVADLVEEAVEPALDAEAP